MSDLDRCATCMKHVQSCRCNSGRVRPREAVVEFARLMELVLRENDHKGKNVKGFKVDVMLERLWDEVREVDREAWGHPNITTTSQQKQKIMKEAVDVANIAMMIYFGSY